MIRIVYIYMLLSPLVVLGDPTNPYAVRGNIKMISSELWNDTGGKKYPVKNLLDGDTNTAWVFEKDYTSQKEVSGIVIQFFEPQEVDGISLINGYAKSKTLYESNNSVATFELIFSTGEIVVFNCQNSIDYQVFSFPKRKVDWLIFKVLSQRKGNKYDDLCISELSPTLKGMPLIDAEPSTVIYSNGAEYESDHIVDIKTGKSFSTVDWDFVCGAQLSFVDVQLDKAVYFDGCDGKRVIIFNLDDFQYKSIEGEVWLSYQPRAILNNDQLLIGNANEYYIYDPKTEHKKRLSISHNIFWNWGKELEKYLPK